MTKTQLLTRGAMVGVVAAALGAIGGCQSLDNMFGARRSPAPPPPSGTLNNGRAPMIAQAPPTARDSANAAVMRAQSAEAAGDYEKALEEFERAIETNPRLTVAYLGAGDMYREKGDYKTAEQRYGAAATLEPRNFDAQYLHGLTLQLMARFEDAIRAYIRALTIRPDDFNANLNLGTAYLQLNEPRQALPYAERAVKIDGENAAARSNLGDLRQPGAARGRDRGVSAGGGADAAHRAAAAEPGEQPQPGRAARGDGQHARAARADGAHGGLL